MKILEFGDTSKRKIILLHGFQIPYQVWNKYIQHYENDFHVIVPIITGHNPEKSEDFISFSEEAKELEDYYISHYKKQVYAVYGMSMGGVLAATLWQNKKLEIEKVIFDGSPLVSVNNFIKKIMLRFYLDVTHKTQQRDKMTLEQATKSIVSPEHFDAFLQVLDNMSDTTIINCINDIGNFRLKNDIDTPNTTIYYYHGTAANELLAKKSAKLIKKNYPNTKIKCFNGKAHCENALFYPEVMIEELDANLK